MVRKLTDEERSRWHKFKKRGGHNLTRCPVNMFIPDLGCSDKHELAKLRKWLELRRLDHAVICEAVECKAPNLRRDIVDLTDDIIYEVECDKKRALRFKDQKNVEVIELWKQ